MRFIGKRFFYILLFILLPACWQQSQDTVCVVPEYVMTEGNKELNIDSVAIWHGQQGQHWLIATAKAHHTLPVYDAITGKLIKKIGEPGIDHWQLQRPNGIAVADNILFVIERDNKRLQWFKLPEGESLGFSSGIMHKPYGIAVYKPKPDHYMIYITDNEGPKDRFKPRKVHHYELIKQADDYALQFIRTFGDDHGPGALWKVESIAVDADYNRLFIADEHESQKSVKIYTLDGTFTGGIIGKGLIKYEPEGIALYKTSEKHGYILVTDQDIVENRFYLFDRASLMPIKPFNGKQTRRTDGVAITNQSFGPFKAGAFYAVHNDDNIAAYDWHQLADICGLQEKEPDTQ